MSTPSLTEGNRLQRAYFAWAAPRYACMPADVREQVEATDRFLYSRRGAPVWVAMVVAAAAMALGLRQTGMPWLLAIAVGLVIGVSLPLLGVSAWLMPNVFGRWAQMRKLLGLTLGGGLAGMVAGFVVGHVGRNGRLDLALLWDELGRKAVVALPAVALAVAALLGLAWAIARVRRQVLERQLERARMQHERDTAAREATEARLKLLQAQIQPHFIFNTLAAVQHWVDETDPRRSAAARADVVPARLDRTAGTRADTVRGRGRYAAPRPVGDAGAARRSAALRDPDRAACRCMRTATRGSARR